MRLGPVTPPADLRIASARLMRPSWRTDPQDGDAALAMLNIQRTPNRSTIAP